MLIVLCDDHVLLVEALASLLRSAGHTVLTAGSPDLGAQLVAVHRPDVCVMDVGFPDGSGLEALGRIRECCPDSKVLMLSAADDADTIASAVDLGAAGYVGKDVGVTDIIRAVERVHDGETVLGPKVARTLARRTEVDPDDIHWLVAFLTKREREVAAPHRDGPEHRGDVPEHEHQPEHGTHPRAERAAEAGRALPPAGGGSGYPGQRLRPVVDHVVRPLSTSREVARSPPRTGVEHSQPPPLLSP